MAFDRAMECVLDDLDPSFHRNNFGSTFRNTQEVDAYLEFHGTVRAVYDRFRWDEGTYREASVTPEWPLVVAQARDLLRMLDSDA